MDEYNNSNSNNNNSQNGQEPSTPFQTPVRGASSGGPQAGTGTGAGQNTGASGQGGRQQKDRSWEQDTQRTGTYSSGNSADKSGSYSSGNSTNGTGTPKGNPYSQWGSAGNSSQQSANTSGQGGSRQNSNPYSQRPNAGGQNRGTQQNNPYSQWGPSPGNGGNGRGPKKPKKGGNGPKYIALAIVIGVVAFVGGMALGGGLDFGALNTNDSAGASSATTTESGSALPDDSTKVQISSSSSADSGEENADGLSSTQIYKNVSPSIVSIVVDDITVGSEASGSGVIMSKDGYIITNDHVVSDGNKFTVITSDSKQYDAELVGTDSQTDLAVLKISADDLTPAEFGESDKLQVGDRCYAIGSPGGVEFQNSFSGGYVSAIDRDVTINDRVMSLIQTDAAINPGSSGGALINTSGQVIGITSSKLSSSGSSSEASFEGMGFAIPMSTAEKIVDELIAYGHVTGRPAIGISGYDIDENTAAYYNVPQGVLVSSVDEASDAYKQGVQANDIITGVNGKDITTMSEINEIKEECKAGDTMTLTIYRSGKTKKIKITLMDQNDLTSTTSSSDDSSSDGSQSQDGTYGYGYGNGNSGDSSQGTNPFGY